MERRGTKVLTWYINHKCQPGLVVEGNSLAGRGPLNLKLHCERWRGAYTINIELQIIEVALSLGGSLQLQVLTASLQLVRRRGRLVQSSLAGDMWKVLPPMWDQKAAANGHALMMWSAVSVCTELTGCIFHNVLLQQIILALHSFMDK